MKKVIVVLTVVFGAFLANAQTGFQAGADVGFPIGDAGDFYSFNVGVNLAYSYAASDQFDVGVQSGYDGWIGKDYKYSLGGVEYTIPASTASFIPVSALLAFHVTPKLYLGGNVGYAIGVSKGLKGGFLYQPKVGYNAESFNLYGFYKGISQSGGGGSNGSVGIGFMYKF